MSESKEKKENYPKLEEYKIILNAIERAREERERAPIGGITIGELEFAIRAVIRDEAINGSLPLLSRGQKRTLKSWFWISLAIALAIFIYSQIYWVSGPYRIKLENERLQLVRTIDGQSKQFDLEMSDKGWKVCSEGGCGSLLVPLEANFNDRTKFQFLVNGQVFWIWNDLSYPPKQVKLIDGEWSFEDENSDQGWTSFEVLRFQMIDSSRSDDRY